VAAATGLERERPNRVQASSEGAYLTNGLGLFRVLPAAPDQPRGTVWLEDCRHPERFATQHHVGDLCKGEWRLVRPE
jgi:hypothetical protein